MKYLSVCSGIEAATVAWHDLGWTPVAVSEIEPFPSAVLKHHYPHVPNVGDMTKFKEWNLEPIDLLVGGTPCQSFSVAGLRKGLDDPRGNLMLTFLAIAERHRPQWIVWENVPGVLSSNGGRDFGTFLAALGELGYGWAYRVLDAQWFGVAQRRRRVFVVGCLGDQSGAAAVLFESESVQRNPAPSREKGQSVAGTIAARFGISRNNHEECVPTVTGSLDIECGGGRLTHQPVAIQGTLIGRGDNAGPQGSGVDERGSMFTLTKTDVHAVAQPVAICTDMRGHGDGHTAPTLRAKETANDFAPMVAVAQPVATFSTPAIGDIREDDIASTVTRNSGAGGETQNPAFVMQPVGTDCYNGAITGEVAATIGTPGSSVNASGPTVMQAVDVKQVQWASGGGQVENDTAQALRAGAEYNYQFARVAMQVRRLTPTECERLQGFPDGYTNIPWRKKPEAPDGPRYKALGNSMAVPCMKWIGERINRVMEVPR